LSAQYNKTSEVKTTITITVTTLIETQTQATEINPGFFCSMQYIIVSKLMEWHCSLSKHSCHI